MDAWRSSDCRGFIIAAWRVEVGSEPRIGRPSTVGRVQLILLEYRFDKKKEASSYLIDDSDLLWYNKIGLKPALAISRSCEVNMLALVHTHHGHPELEATSSILKDKFHWQGLSKDARDKGLSCGCRRRKCTSEQRIGMLQLLEPWEVQ